MACVFGLFGAMLFFTPSSNAQTTTSSSSVMPYPQIHALEVNVNESESANVLVPVNNSGSPLSWSDIRLDYQDSNPGIKITTDPLLFVEAPVLPQSDNYSLSIGISVAQNVSVGQYTIPFTFSAKSSIYSPSISTIARFNLIITVLKSQPRPFPVLLLFPPFILVTAATMIGIVLKWSKDWNLSEVKK